MNLNLVAVLFAACASFTAALKDGQKHELAKAPLVRHSKKTGYSQSSSHQSKQKISKSSQKVSSSNHKVSKSSTSRSLTPHPSSSLKLSSDKHERSKCCSRELEAILYSPPSTVKDYLANIAAQMRTNIQVIMIAFADGNLEYLRKYVEEYNIYVTVAGPFGLPVIVTRTFIATTTPLKNVGTAQTYVGHDGFYVDSINGYYNYQFSFMSSNGQYITFVLSLPLSAMANSPTNC
jgi:hypothetical protein